MSIEWEDLPSETLDIMKQLGDFSPTVHAQSREVKGCLRSEYDEDGTAYFDSDDLRGIAIACNEVAAWLDARADEVKA